MTDLVLILEAARFAAERHSRQRRKDADASPYINHPLALAAILAAEGGIDDGEVIAAALLHDTVEDTETSPAELAARFGARVAGMVAEVTDDKALPYADRKRLQVEHAATASHGARLVKLADKIANLRDLAASPPTAWDARRRRAYVAWSTEVVANLRDASSRLALLFDEVAGAMPAWEDAA